MRLNPRVKRKWVRALRSGKYDQGHGDLVESSGGYCCLGVLVEEAAPEFLVRDWFGEGYVASRARKDYGFIPDDLAVMWGLDDKTQKRLSQMNDSGRIGFPRIATWIEQNL